MSTFFSHVTVKPQKSIQESIVVENSTLKPPKSMQESVMVENNTESNFDQINDGDRIFVINAISRLC